MTEELTLGGFYQIAKNETSSTTQNAETELDSDLIMIYASFVLPDDVYLQGGFGIGDLTFDIDRTVNGDDYTASRNGEKLNWILAASRGYEIDGYDVSLTLDAAYQSIKLDAYRESTGMATYQYLRQEMRTYYIGGNFRFSDSFTNDWGNMTVYGQMGYQADISAMIRWRAPYCWLTRQPSMNIVFGPMMTSNRCHIPASNWAWNW